MTRSSSAPDSIHEKALADLRYIRATVESAGAFTAVSGLGGLIMGVVGLVAALVAAGPASQPGLLRQWLWIWLAAAFVATSVGIVSMVLKSRQAGASLVSAPARRFALAFLPAIAAGGALTITMVNRGAFDLLPPLWLLMYGVAVSAGGALSVRVVPFMGITLLLMGVAALFVPFAAANILLGLGFGVVQILGGVVIMRRYGG